MYHFKTDFLLIIIRILVLQVIFKLLPARRWGKLFKNYKNLVLYISDIWILSWTHTESFLHHLAHQPRAFHLPRPAGNFTSVTASRVDEFPRPRRPPIPVSLSLSLFPKSPKENPRNLARHVNPRAAHLRASMSLSVSLSYSLSRAQPNLHRTSVTGIPDDDEHVGSTCGYIAWSASPRNSNLTLCPARTLRVAAAGIWRRRARRFRLVIASGWRGRV